ncbi:MAG: TonB-dependent receptor [Pseudomonadota bacterium]
MKPPVPHLLACLLACAGAADADDVLELSLEQLLQIDVVGASKYAQKQNEVAAAVSVITRKEIQTFGWRTVDEALASLPGVYVIYDRQYSYLGTRGFDSPGDFSTRILVLINGNRINNPTYDNGGTGRTFPLDIDLIERIEFIPGPGGAVYGQNAMLGVVNVITRSGAALDGAELAAAYQRPQAQREGRLSWGKLYGNGIDAVVSMSGLRARGETLFMTFPGAPVGAGLAPGLDNARDVEMFVRLARGSWSFDQVYGNFRKGDATGAFLSDPLVPGQFQRDRYTLSQLQFQDLCADDSLQVLARVFKGEYRYASTLVYGSTFEFPATGNWHGAELRLLSTAIANHKLLVGLEGQDNSRIEQKVLDQAHPENDLAIAVSGYRLGLYLQDEWRLDPALTSTLGVRVDRNNVTGTQVSPRMALIWRAAPATNLKALYGRAHRAPNSYERDFGDGLSEAPNPALRGESIQTLELVADHRVGPALSLRASAFEWRMDGQVTLGTDPLSGLSQYFNGEQVRTRGVELSGDSDGSHGARLRASLAYQSAAYANGAGLADSPRLLAKLNASSGEAFGPMRLAYEFQYYGARRTIGGARLGGYALSNLNLSSNRLARRLELSLGVSNLFDKRYAHPASSINWQDAFAQDGRALRLKLGYLY